MTIRDIGARLHRACGRRLAKWLARRPFVLPAGAPIVSFTFDDFPRSALVTGGDILEQFGAAGTYYASLGLMKQVCPTGVIFEPDDLKSLHDRGHELGCHTFDHCHAGETNPNVFEASVVRNAEALRALAPTAAFKTHSYPISYPRPGTKQRLAKYFACCRGGGQTFNLGKIDLNYISAFFLEQSRDQPDMVKETIKLNHAAGGWLVFATHDVCDRPTRFGCTPGFFQDIVKATVSSGTQILPVFRALETFAARARPAP